MRFTRGGFLLGTDTLTHRLAASPATSRYDHRHFSLSVTTGRQTSVSLLHYTLATKRTVINCARSRVCFSFARIAKMLRQSIRRSVRRLAHVLGNHHQTAILGESSSSSSAAAAAARTVQAAATSSHHHQQTTVLSGTTQPPPQTDVQHASAALSPPPDYSTVLVEMNRDDDDAVSVARTVCGESSSASSLSDEQSTSIECLMERAAPINVDRTGPVAATAVASQ